ncbi:Rieske 2Fe-2S domain-containing protein [Accumulibacter sp.]|uniref:Rieske (2Fe-2S) protein n=1 Tax=Accumulibacter sp. TaxID=2053492 RepID=UPI0025E98C19|nr:Rieske 2Fe-2S domain-containing protein [Accumulibacter sp.]MCP5229341.1 Rieske 2Fe-2S domain-containing protein [Accumulibacter sp.]
MAADERLICRTTDLVDGGPGVRFSVLLHDVEEPAFAVRFRGRVAAYVNRCGHVPVELDWQPGEFFDDSKLYLICATHGALYSPADGRCLGGRCKDRGLAPLAVQERDGAVYYIPSEQKP